MPVSPVPGPIAAFACCYMVMLPSATGPFVGTLLADAGVARCLLEGDSSVELLVKLLLV